MRILKCAVMGAGAVGKTALTCRFMSGEYIETYDPTLEDSYRKQFMVDGQAVILEVLDTAGIDQYLALHDLFVRESDGFVLVFSLSSKESFDDIVKARDQILKLKNEEHVPMVIVGNKCDLHLERTLPGALGESLSKDANSKYLETSARNNVNVQRVFHEVVRQMRLHPSQEQQARELRKRERTMKCVIL